MKVVEQNSFIATMGRSRKEAEEDKTSALEVVGGSRSASKSRSRSKSKSKSWSKSRSRSRSRSYSRSYSRSRSRSPRRRSYSRSRSRSYSRSRSRSPYARKNSNYRGSRSHQSSFSRKRHQGSRDNPPEGKCLGVFGLSLYTTEREVRELFEKYGHVDDCQVVYDHATGRSRGFAFIYLRSVDEAAEAKERLNGAELDGRRIRVDYSITQRAHTPTPGVYMGKPSQHRNRNDHYRTDSRYRDDDRHHRSYRSRSRSYSRSRSRSPRRW